MAKKIYITTAIDYVNAKPHVGHAVEKVQADVLARWYRNVQNQDVYFVSGADENSLKNVQAARKVGKPVKEYVDEYVKYFENLKKEFNLSYDCFVRTTEERHFKGAQKFWNLFKKEDIYKKNYKGYYCVGCEEFKLEKDLIDGKCPEHGTAPELIEEENYFFALSKYQDQLIKLIESGKLEILPDFRKNEVLSFIKGGLADFSISRSVERAENWGVPVPNDPSQVMYVWVDALSNYITALDFDTDGELYKKYWEGSDERIHVIGKGILRFHAVYWTAMLLSAGLPLPTKIISHEYITIDGKKISKSLGNVINPEEVADKFGVDGSRYLLVSSLPSSKDGDISWEKMEEKYKADLSNSLGNLVQRTISMINKYEIKTDRKMRYYSQEEISDADEEKTAKLIYDDYMTEFKFDFVLQGVWGEIRKLNIFIDDKKPWVLAKEDDTAELARVLNVVYWELFDIAKMAEPFMPEIAEKIKDQLESLKPEPLFPRLNEEK
ncbi:MAG: methionine--tRNA ligase [Patescibacteria group bacterium]